MISQAYENVENYYNNIEEWWRGMVWELEMMVICVGRKIVARGSTTWNLIVFMITFAQLINLIDQHQNIFNILKVK